MIGRSPAVLIGLLIAIGCTLVVLAGCGGGTATAQEIAEADAAVHQVTTQPVDCGGGIACR